MPINKVELILPEKNRPNSFDLYVRKVLSNAAVATYTVREQNPLYMIEITWRHHYEHLCIKIYTYCVNISIFDYSEISEEKKDTLGTANIGNIHCREIFFLRGYNAWEVSIWNSKYFHLCIKGILFAGPYLG